MYILRPGCFGWQFYYRCCSAGGAEAPGLRHNPRNTASVRSLVLLYQREDLVLVWCGESCSKGDNRTLAVLGMLLLNVNFPERRSHLLCITHLLFQPREMGPFRADLIPKPLLESWLSADD